MRRTSNHMNSLVLLGFISSILASIYLANMVQACGPGRAGGRRLHNRLRKYPPLVQRQYIPNVSENTLGASGRPEGPIKRRDTKRFKELVQNWNPDIEFRDDERTGADRMMSQRLKEKLSVLAISVMNQWPNVRLRVIEGWDEDMRHSVNSLHYEGRAVDITTSDKDKSKYGMLARLAVEAGFDWVHYESRSHVHCSVKSEKADTIRNNGCFDAKSLVETPMGQMEMSQLQTNDLVLTMNQHGELHFSPVIMWLDRDESSSELYVELTTRSGQLIRLTSSHLLYMAEDLPPFLKPTNQLPTTITVNGNDLSKQRNTSTSPTDAATSDSESENKTSGNNNYYYYDFNSTLPNSAGALKSNESIESSRIKSIGATLLPSKSDQSTLNEYKVDDLNEFVYVTYARNILIGQYVLVNVPEEELALANDKGINRTWLYPKRDVTSKYKSHKRRRNQQQQWQQPIGEQTKSKIKFDQIVSVNYVHREGIYAPLTREGNIVVNSVVASCYAVISDHDMAHWSFAPVRWLNMLQEWIIGLRPETPLEERLVEASEKRVDQERQNHPIEPDHSTTNGKNRTQGRHIHWYPILLYNIARMVLPNNYLY